MRLKRMALDDASNTYPFKITFARVTDWQNVYDHVKRKSDVCDSKSDVPPPDPAWARGPFLTSPWHNQQFQQMQQDQQFQ